MSLSFLKKKKNTTDLLTEATDIAHALEHSGDDTAALRGVMRQGNHAMRQPGPGHEFWQFKPYAPGDATSSIDWKQTAKGDDIVIKQQQKHVDWPVVIVIQNHAGMEFGSGTHNKNDAAKIIGLGLALAFVHAGDPVILPPNENKLRAEKSVAELAYRDETITFPDLTRWQSLPKIMIGDFLDGIETLEAWIETLGASESPTVFIQTLDKDELSLPYDGNILFSAPDGTARTAIEDVDFVRGEYTKRLNAHINSLKQLCASRGYTHILQPTHEPLIIAAQHAWDAMTKIPRGHKI